MRERVDIDQKLVQWALNSRRSPTSFIKVKALNDSLVVTGQHCGAVGDDDSYKGERASKRGLRGSTEGL